MTADQQLKALETTLRQAAEELWAHGGLKPSEYTFPVLGLIFLKYADKRFQEAKNHLEAQQQPNRFGTIEPLTARDFHKKGVLYIPSESSYAYLLDQPESTDYGALINKAMNSIEEHNPELKGVLPKNYGAINKDNLIKLLKTFSQLEQIEGDNFGLIYEFFMGNFEQEAGQKGGEFFTPRSLVKLIVEIIEPYQGKIFDPACGSGGMFVQSLNYIKEHKKSDIVSSIAVYGQEIKTQTIKLAKMNLAINGLEGAINEANTMYEDSFNSPGAFDFVMANPPFNLKGIDTSKITNDPRYPFGIPSVNNANYLWISLFASSLNQTGRAGFVMSAQAGDAGKSDMEIRKKIIESGIVDIMVSVGPNFFYTVTLPCSLWFFDKTKAQTDRKDKVLFIDAKDIYREIDRSHREFSTEQIAFIADIAKLYRGQEISGENPLTKEHFPDGKYQDILGLCKVETIDTIAENSYSLNPGRYTGVAKDDTSDEDLKEKFESAYTEFVELSSQAKILETTIIANGQDLLNSREA